MARKPPNGKPGKTYISGHVKIKSIAEEHLCKCPKCEKDHYDWFEFGYSGRGKPMKFCKECREKRVFFDRERHRAIDDDFSTFA